MDGDGADDTVTVYVDDEIWWVNITLAYGYGSSARIQDEYPFMPEALMVVDLGPPERVALARINSGASTMFVGFFAFLDCQAVHTTIDDEDGSRWWTRIAVFGSASHVDGVTCHPGGITTTSARPVDWGPEGSIPWEYYTHEYEYLPNLGHFRLIASSTTALVWPDDQDIIYSAGQFNCGDHHGPG